MDSDKLRDLRNRVVISGTLAELEVKEGENKNGVPYISLKGAIRFGETGTETKKFRTYVQAQKSDGNENKQYASIKEWADNAVSEATNKDLATMVTITGSLEANDYVASTGELAEGVEINAKFFNDYQQKEDSEDGPAIVDLEGYIKAISDEVKNDVETGRKRVTMISTDFFRNAVVVKNIIVPKELADGFTDMFEVGDTALLFLSYELHKGEKKEVKSGGLGKQRVTEGRDYLELVVVGAPPAEEQGEPIEKKIVKILMEERAQKLEELKEQGYQGTTTTNTPNNTKTTSKKTTKKVTEEDIDDDDIPF